MNAQLVKNSLSPSRVIVVFESKKQYNKDFYLETREVNRKNGKYEIGSPKPLPEFALKEIAQLYSKKNSVKMDFSGLIDPHLLFTCNKPGATIVMWYREATVTALNFSEDKKIKNTSRVHIPALLYLVINNKLNIYALADNSRPTLQTKLFNAPFFNIYDDGNVCLGTAPIGNKKATTYDDEALRFERGFFLAEQNGGDRIGRTKTPIQRLWPMLIKSNKPFPKKELVQHKRYPKLGTLVQKLIGNNFHNNIDDFHGYEDEDEYDNE